MFFYNLIVVAAKAITSIDCKCDNRADLPYACSRLGGGGGDKGVSTCHTPHAHIHTHREVFKENFEKICYKCIHLCSFLYFKFSCKASESLKLLISPLSGKNDATVQVTDTLNTIFYKV